MYPVVDVKLITFLILVLGGGGGGGHSVVQLVKVLRYKPEGRGFDSQWGMGIFH